MKRDRKEYNRQYRLKNAAKLKESHRRYREANPDKFAEYGRRYRSKNADAYRAYLKAYYQTHKKDKLTINLGQQLLNKVDRAAREQVGRLVDLVDRGHLHIVIPAEHKGLTLAEDLLIHLIFLNNFLAAEILLEDSKGAQLIHLTSPLWKRLRA